MSASSDQDRQALAGLHSHRVADAIDQNVEAGHLAWTDQPQPTKPQAETAPADRVPPHYAAATWRNTTPFDRGTGHLGVGFNTTYGIVFMRLHADDILKLRDSLTDELEVLRSDQPSGSHPETSAGSRPGTECSSAGGDLKNASRAS